MTLSAETTSARPAPGMSLNVIPTGAALGAEVRGVDLKRLDDASFAQLMDAWHAYSVLLFRGQSLSDQELIAFSRRLGDLDWAPVQETGRRFVEGLPEIYIVSNVKVNGEPIGSLGDGEAVWHTDMSYLDMPPKASMLYSLEIPTSGGNTSFCSMYAIYDALPAKLRERIAGLKIKHDGTYNSGGYVRQGVTPTDDPRESPAFEIIEELLQLGAELTYHDPHIANMPRMRKHDIRLASQPLTPQYLADQDCVLIVTDHSAVDWNLVLKHARLVVDPRNALDKIAGNHEHDIS